ncbi:MAG: S41 family peptidase, partial [Planctomycetes bacterium]|nr:S41 family peptidase [Planctomycetota bacterium]
DGRNLRGNSLEYAVDLIAGPVGEGLTLRVLRDGRSHLVTLARARVPIYSVSDVRLLGAADRVGYIKLDKFSASSVEEMDRALWQLHQQNMQSLIVDVRGNPGGLLTTAITLSDKFVPAGEIVSTRGRTAGDNSSQSATWANTWKVPLVVLVDGDSASASEIFAAAIQENGRGVVVGERSYGKGTVQTHFPLRSVAGNLRLTTAKFYSPRGRAMAGSGVEPDVAAADRDNNLKTDEALDVALNVAKTPQVRELAETSGTRRTTPANVWEGLSLR